MTGNSVTIQGGCLCGEIRFSIETQKADTVDYCHCGKCRKASGAPVTAWIQIDPARFRLIAGDAQAFRSSARATRWFCGTCGSTLHMSDPDNRSIGVPLGALDEPDAIKPTVHGWVSDRLSWLMLQDGLPEYDDDPPYDL